MSPNPAIRDEYQNIRRQLTSVLRGLELVRDNGDDSATVLSLDELKAEIDERDGLLDSTVDGLIRNNLITAEMATSLMNDSSYAHDVATKLVSMGEVLFSTGDINLRDAERNISLDEDEIDEALASSR
ncbi:MAG TPA: hypothetical protein DDW45_04340 [Gammaproteobacteria bacterium]|nr:hypothetical protein [Gammaproteobacteria bacterium]